MTAKKPTNDEPKTRERRALGGSIVKVSARPGALFGQLRRNGKRVQKLLVSAEEAATVEDPKQLAEKRLAAWSLEVETADPSDGSLRTVTLAEFLPEFYELAESRVGERHVEALRNRLDRAAKHFGETKLAKIDRAAAETYLAKLSREDGRLETVETVGADGKVEKKTFAHPMSAGTLKVHRSALSACWAAAVDRRAAPSNPWRSVRVARGQEFVARLLTHDEVERIVAHVSPQVRPLIAFLAETGLRLGEAQGLTWQCVERDHSKIVVAKSKSGRSRVVPTTARARDILAKLWTAHVVPMNGPDIVFAEYERSYVWHLFHDGCKRAGVGKGVRVHDLRHHVGTSLAQAGVPIPTIMGILGHSQIATTQRYAAHLPTNAAASAFAALEALRGVASAAPKVAATAS